jgi:hypothetical protein
MNQAKETPRARQAWADYLAMGPDRSLARLHTLYVKRGQKRGASGAPTKRMSQLEAWSSKFGWQDRLRSLADQQVAAAEQAERVRIRMIMETGFAQAHERVAVLKELADCLLTDLRDPEKRWLRDIKGIGHGDNWTQIEIDRFNAGELEQLRALLDDIAKETGGRPKTVKVDIETRIRLIAREMGLDEDETVAEAQRILEASSAASR